MEFEPSFKSSADQISTVTITKAWHQFFFPSVSAHTTPRVLYPLEFRSMTKENFLVIKETLKVDRIIAVIFRDVKHTKVLS